VTAESREREFRAFKFALFDAATASRSLSAIDCRVLWRVLKRMGPGAYAFPAPTTLMAECGISESAVRKSLAALRAGGWIVQVEKGGGRWSNGEHLGRTSRYYVPDAVPGEKPCTQEQG
jgi:hypothetical protein